MRTDSFDFSLPAEHIALRPHSPREEAKLLVIPEQGAFRDLQIYNISSFLKAGDALIVNDTKVLPARLHGIRRRPEGDAKIEATLIAPWQANIWRVLIKGSRKLKEGDRLIFGGLEAKLVRKKGTELLLEFSEKDMYEALQKDGVMPLPPYIASKRKADEQDRQDYQTIFANKSGAIAAPTAGLHFTPSLIQQIEEAGIHLHRLTLHVGIGTFLPVEVENIEEHKMHSEWAKLTTKTANSLNEIRKKGGRIIAVGTTSLRVLETAADEKGILHPFEGNTDIFITPGYSFKIVDMLMTNFHLPQSTLFMLVCAFSGTERMKQAYAHAIANKYRFYSYGDACLLERAK
ncbi:MAG: tRNA preQ1(34) S-adenosylmethionine ribosyltransferase-isomerase QueA [Parvibaculales bacterium]